MAIEVRYHLKSRRHVCEWKPYGGEAIRQGADGALNFFKPANVEASCGKDAEGEYGNIDIQEHSKMALGAKLWEGDKCQEIGTSTPIVLIPGQILQIYARGLYAELSINPEGTEPIAADGENRIISSQGLE